MWKWTVPESGGNPVVEAGVRIAGPAAAGTVYLDYLDWRGVPRAHLGRPGRQPATERPLATEAPWRRAWANGVDLFENRAREEEFRLIQNAGIGLLIRGDRTWRDYTLTATVRLHMATAGGIGVRVRVQGMRRYYALLLTGSGKIRLVRRSDGEETILDEAPLGALADVPQRLTLTADGETITGSVGDRPALSASDATFDGGAVALLCTEGRIEVSGVHIAPLQETPAT